MENRDIRFNRDFMNIYLNPRISAEAAYALSIGDEAVLSEELEIETYLNQILDQIIVTVNDCRNGKSLGSGNEFQTYIDFVSTAKTSSKIVVINALRDLGYVVKSALKSDEEVEHVRGICRMAEADNDEMLMGILDEAFFANDCFKIYWGKPSKI